MPFCNTEPQSIAPWETIYPNYVVYTLNPANLLHQPSAPEVKGRTINSSPSKYHIESLTFVEERRTSYSRNTIASDRTRYRSFKHPTPLVSPVVATLKACRVHHELSQPRRGWVEWQFHQWISSILSPRQQSFAPHSALKPYSAASAPPAITKPCGRFGSLDGNSDRFKSFIASPATRSIASR